MMLMEPKTNPKRRMLRSIGEGKEAAPLKPKPRLIITKALEAKIPSPSSTRIIETAPTVCVLFLHLFSPHRQHVPSTLKLSVMEVVPVVGGLKVSHDDIIEWMVEENEAS